MPDSSPKWTALHDSDGDFAIYDQDEKLVAVTDGETQWDAGNAALIAAAPDMLQALELWMEYGRLDPNHPDSIEVYKLARSKAESAISAAKGAE